MWALIRYGKRFEPTVPLRPKRATIGAMAMIVFRLSDMKGKDSQALYSSEVLQKLLISSKGQGLRMALEHIMRAKQSATSSTVS